MVTLNRPDARNALDLSMCQELYTVFSELDTDPTVRVVLLKAAGSAFCAGADLKERAGKDQAWIWQRRLASYSAYETIERCRKPIVALVAGPVVGSGGEIAMSCDFIVAANDTSFRFPEPHHGTIGATQRLQRVIGKRRAKELLFTNRTMLVEEAERYGLVSRVVARDQLDSTGDEFAAAIATAPPATITLTKQTVDLGAETDLPQGIRIEIAAVERSLSEGGGRPDIESLNATAKQHTTEDRR